MGIKHSEGNGGRGLIFINIDNKHGVLTQKGEPLPQGSSVEGILTKFQIRPEKFEHNGQTIFKESIALRLEDSDPSQPAISLNFTICTGGNGEDIPGDASYSALRALAKINAANLSLPIEIKPWAVAKGQKFGDGVADKDMTGIAVKQGGQSLKDDFGNGVTELPKLQTVMANGKPVLVQGKEIKDKAPWNAHLDSLLEQIAAKLPAMNQAQGQGQGNDDTVDPDIAAEAAAAAAQQAAAHPEPSASANRAGFRQRA